MTLHIRLLGKTSLSYGETLLELSPGKTSALLCYLAYQQDWVRRSDLMYLFWADSEEQKASSNLRQLLRSLKPLPYTEGLERQVGRLRWRISSDVKNFQDALRNKDWGAAVSSYQGELLSSFHVTGSPEFESWLSFERESLARQWHEAMLELAQELQRSDRHEQAAKLLEQAIKANPLDEEALQQYLNSPYAQEQPNQALRLYESFCSYLERELDSSPSQTTQHLANHLRSGNLSSPEVRIAITTNPKRLRLPSQLTAFIGREEEKRHLIHRLSQAEVHLLSIVAPGGMGKTRLALAVAESLEAQFTDGAIFVSFAATAEPQQMLSTLASSLEFSFYGQDDPKLQLLSYLSSKDILLVLDNLEHLAHDASLIVDLLQHCPRLKLLATSRERLKLSSEYSYDLQGLQYPDVQYPDDTTELGNELVHYDAVHYFIREAQRHQAVSADTHDILRLCQLVQGMPLALTLAAAWLRILPLRDIITELQESLELLETEAADLPERHRSMRSIFDNTWQRLSAAEQSAWAQLSVFTGGLTREAAQEVFDISLPQLLSLSNKSLINRQAERFYQHPLLQQYGREQAQELGIWERSQEKHSQYYAKVLQQQGEALKGAGQVQALNLLDNELANIRAAWQQALQSQDFKRLSSMTPALTRYTNIRHLWQDKEAIFKEAIDTLEKTSISKDQQLALARALPHAAENHALWLEQTRRSLAIAERWGDTLGCATAHMLLCDRSTVAEGQAHFDTALQLFAKLGDSEGMMISYRCFSWFLITSGFYQQAGGYLEQARELCKQVGNTIELALVLDVICGLNNCLGDFDYSKTLALEVQAILQDLNLPHQFVEIFGTIGWLEHWRGNFAEAKIYIKAYIEAHEAVGNTTLRPHLYSELNYSEGNHEQAMDFAHTFLAIHQKFQVQDAMTILVLLILGRVSIRQNNLESAEKYLLEAHKISQAIHGPRLLLDIGVAIAELLLYKGSHKLAAEIISIVKDHPAIDSRIRWELTKLLDKWTIERAITSFHEPDKLAWLDQVVTEVLTQ